MVVLIVGAVFFVLGILGLVIDWMPGEGVVRGYSYLWMVLKGSLPIMFVLFGLAALAVGISSMKDKAASSKEEKKE